MQVELDATEEGRELIKLGSLLARVLGSSIPMYVPWILKSWNGSLIRINAVENL